MGVRETGGIANPAAEGPGAPRPGSPSAPDAPARPAAPAAPSEPGVPAPEAAKPGAPDARAAAAAPGPATPHRGAAPEVEGAYFGDRFGKMQGPLEAAKEAPSGDGAGEAPDAPFGEAPHPAHARAADPRAPGAERRASSPELDDGGALPHAAREPAAPETRESAATSGYAPAESSADRLDRSPAKIDDSDHEHPRRARPAAGAEEDGEVSLPGAQQRKALRRSDDRFDGGGREPHPERDGAAELFRALRDGLRRTGDLERVHRVLEGKDAGAVRELAQTYRARFGRDLGSDLRAAVESPEAGRARKVLSEAAPGGEVAGPGWAGDLPSGGTPRRGGAAAFVPIEMGGRAPPAPAREDPEVGREVRRARFTANAPDVPPRSTSEVPNSGRLRDQVQRQLERRQDDAGKPERRAASPDREQPADERTAAAHQLFGALAGGALRRVDDYDRIQKALGGKDDHDIQALADFYGSEFGRDLAADLKKASGSPLAAWARGVLEPRAGERKTGAFTPAGGAPRADSPNPSEVQPRSAAEVTNSRVLRDQLQRRLDRRRDDAAKPERRAPSPGGEQQPGDERTDAAHQLFGALRGGGVRRVGDYDRLQKALDGKDDREIRALGDLYRAEFGRDLAADLKAAPGSRLTSWARGVLEAGGDRVGADVREPRPLERSGAEQPERTSPQDRATAPDEPSAREPSRSFSPARGSARSDQPQRTSPQDAATAPDEPSAREPSRSFTPTRGTPQPEQPQRTSPQDAGTAPAEPRGREPSRSFTPARGIPQPEQPQTTRAADEVTHITRLEPEAHEPSRPFTPARGTPQPKQPQRTSPQDAGTAPDEPRGREPSRSFTPARGTPQPEQPQRTSPQDPATAPDEPSAREPSRPFTPARGTQQPEQPQRTSAQDAGTAPDEPRGREPPRSFTPARGIPQPQQPQRTSAQNSGTAPDEPHGREPSRPFTPARGTPQPEQPQRTSPQDAGTAPDEPSAREPSRPFTPARGTVRPEQSRSTPPESTPEDPRSGERSGAFTPSRETRPSQLSQAAVADAPITPDAARTAGLDAPGAATPKESRTGGFAPAQATAAPSPHAGALDPPRPSKAVPLGAIPQSEVATRSGEPSPSGGIPGARQAPAERGAPAFRGAPPPAPGFASPPAGTAHEVDAPLPGVPAPRAGTTAPPEQAGMARAPRDRPEREAWPTAERDPRDRVAPAWVPEPAPPELRGRSVPDSDGVSGVAAGAGAPAAPRARPGDGPAAAAEASAPTALPRTPEQPAADAPSGRRPITAEVLMPLPPTLATGAAASGPIQGGPSPVAAAPERDPAVASANPWDAMVEPTRILSPPARAQPGERNPAKDAAGPAVRTPPRARRQEPAAAEARPGLGLGLEGDELTPAMPLRAGQVPLGALEDDTTPLAPAPRGLQVAPTAALLSGNLTTEELGTLSRSAGVDWDALGGAGAGKAEKAELLVRSFESQGTVSDFLAAAKTLRPELRAALSPAAEPPPVLAPLAAGPGTPDGVRTLSALVRLSPAESERIATQVLEPRSLDWDDLGSPVVGRAERLARLVRHAEVNGFLPELQDAAQLSVRRDSTPRALLVPVYRPMPAGESGRLARVLGFNFSSDELRALASDVFEAEGLGFEDFGGPRVGRFERAGQLVAHADAAGRTGEVTAWAREQAPDVFERFDRDPAFPPEVPLPTAVEVRRDDERVADRLVRSGRAFLETLTLDVFFERSGLDFEDFGGPGTGDALRAGRMVAFARENHLLEPLLARAGELERAGVVDDEAPPASPNTGPAQPGIAEASFAPEADRGSPAPAPASGAAAAPAPSLEPPAAEAEGARELPREVPRTEAMIAAGVPLMQAAPRELRDPAVARPVVSREAAAVTWQPVRRKKRPRRWLLFLMSR